MTQFDALDVIAARSVAVLHNEPVIWRPMRARTMGTYVAVEGGDPDDERPVQEIEGIVSWRPEGLPVVPGGQAGPGEATVMVDFEAGIFERDDTIAYGKPRKGDRLEVPEQDPADRMMEIREVGDDGSRRVFAWCSVVSSTDWVLSADEEYEDSLMSPHGAAAPPPGGTEGAGVYSATGGTGAYSEAGALDSAGAGAPGGAAAGAPGAAAGAEAPGAAGAPATLAGKPAQPALPEPAPEAWAQPFEAYEAPEPGPAAAPSRQEARREMARLAKVNGLTFTSNADGVLFTGPGGFRCQVSGRDYVEDLAKLRAALGEPGAAPVKGEEARPKSAGAPSPKPKPKAPSGPGPYTVKVKE